MAGAFDQTWYRVADLRPRLRLHAVVHRQTGRGGVWYVVRDHQTGRHFRVSTAAHALLAMMDGRRTVAEMLARLARHMGSDRPGRGEVVRLLVQLHHGDLLATPLPPDLAELDRRAGRQAKGKFWATLRNPLAIRVPLWDPDRFLNATAPFVRFLCRPVVLLAVLALILAGGLSAAMHFNELTHNVSDRVFAADNVLLIVLLYPLAKALHEAGHAYAVKLGGGEVHEIGVMLLVLFPVPYVDASASAAFPDRWRRALVGSAGMLVELVIAAVAALAWVWLDPGPLRAAALDLMVLCGVSTLLFNGNPLLRFDGYYVLSDLIAVPNLDTRARRYLVYLIQRYLLGMRDQRSPVEVPGEGRWLLGFGVLSLSYRLAMVLGIGLFVASRWFLFGVLLATVSAAQMTLWPLLRGVRYLTAGRELRGRRRRALLGAGGAVLAVITLLFVVPLPHALVAPGAVWVPPEATIRAGADGFVAEIVTSPGADVDAGTPLFRLEDPVASARSDVLAAEVSVQESRYNAVNQIDLAQARLISEQLHRAEANYARAKERMEGLVAVATQGGRFVVPELATLQGRYVRKGDVLGYVLGAGDVAVHVVVSQSELDQVREHTTQVEVLLNDGSDKVIPAQVTRETPSALERAPAPALSPEGGGPMLRDPASPNHERPLDRWYQFELALRDQTASGAAIPLIGEHAEARFNLGSQPVAWRAAIWARQLVLRRLSL